MKVCSKCMKKKEEITRFDYYIFNELREFYICDECINSVSQQVTSMTSFLLLFNDNMLLEKDKRLPKCAYCLNEIRRGKPYIEFNICETCNVTQPKVAKIIKFLWYKKR